MSQNSQIQANHLELNTKTEICKQVYQNAYQLLKTLKENKDAYPFLVKNLKKGTSQS